MPEDHRLLPATELSDRDDEHQSFPTIDLQDINILSIAPIDNSESRSFPEPKFRNRDMRDDRWSSKLRGEDDERRSFPTVDLQGVDIWSLASMDNLGRQSFPALELL